MILFPNKFIQGFLEDFTYMVPEVKIEKLTFTLN